MPNSSNLKSKLIFRFLTAFGAVALMLFLPAGSLAYWQAWLYLAIVFVPMALGSVYFYRSDPSLVARRLQTREKIEEQGAIIRIARLVFFAALLLPGFDYRFGWSHLSRWATIFCQALVLAGLLITFWVMASNSFASRIIEVERGQCVISTGPYRWVRHPMYFGAMIVLLFTPLGLGSYWALPAFALVIPFIVLRLLGEERILRQELPGYAEYCLRTRFRLFPLVW
jgi:protein-S-isoprenylcysteine O-methyltransferase Ste14